MRWMVVASILAITLGFAWVGLHRQPVRQDAMGWQHPEERIRTCGGPIPRNDTLTDPQLRALADYWDRQRYCDDAVQGRAMLIPLR